MTIGYMYILECSDGSYYTGSTKDLNLRLEQHQNGFGALHTAKKLPVKLVYYEEFQRIDEAFYREKQVQGWSRKKKKALLENNYNDLKRFAICQNETNSDNWGFDSAQPPKGIDNNSDFSSAQPPKGIDNNSDFSSAQPLKGIDNNSDFSSSQPPKGIDNNSDFISAQPLKGIDNNSDFSSAQPPKGIDNNSDFSSAQPPKGIDNNSDYSSAQPPKGIDNNSDFSSSPKKGKYEK